MTFVSIMASQSAVELGRCVRVRRPAGVVEQQIDPIERFEVFPAFGFAAYVEAERAATAALRFDGGFERCQPFGAAPRGDDVVSEGCEP